MKDYVLHESHPPAQPSFLTGLVFGFDVGTGSIGYAVRKGSEFKDVGVLICDSEGSDLSKRRDLRRQRRTLRSKKFRRQWFAKELGKLGLPKPTEEQLKRTSNETNEQFDQRTNPISLRVRALNEPLEKWQLFIALTHLFKRRGYEKDVPWANKEKDTKAKKKNDAEEWGSGTTPPEKVQSEFDASGCKYPCEFLARNPKNQRRRVWPRALLEKEFHAIAKAQTENKNFPQLTEKIDWLLYGKTKEVKGHHVYFKITEAQNPGVLGLHWPRFDNRGPALDSLQPVDEQGRPMHVVRKNKEAFTKAQWELALINFRVIDRASGKLVTPDSKSLVRLREIWESGKRKKKKESASDKEESETIKISEPVLKRWAKDFVGQYKLVDGQQPLTPQTGSGRARYSSPTLERIIAGEQFDPPQPLLRRKNETPEQALNRYMTDIKHPLVRQRLTLFQKLLQKLVSRFGKPDMIVLEAVRSLALGKDKKRELIQRIHNNREERDGIRKELSKDGFSSSKNSILRYRLFKEAKGRCPFCLCPFCLQEVVYKEAEIEHIVPRSRVDCNEFYNLTVAHQACNKKKDNRTPWEAYGGTNDWEALRKNAEDCFGIGSLKYQVFINPDAQNLIEEKSDLQHTAYIARVIRQVSLIQLNWLAEDGRDATGSKDHQMTAWRFQVTNGQLTSRLRKSWGLNQILHPFPSRDAWEAMTPEEQDKKKIEVQEKNRGDLRHHSLDAMVICCTLPWLAHRTHGAKDQFGQHGWWTQDEKQRSKASNPVFPKDGEMHDVVKNEIEKVVVKQHVSRSNHQQAYATTLYAKKADNTYVAREIFTSLTPKNLCNIWPDTFASYCETAWRRYADEAADLEDELKKTKGNLPPSFTNKLCFAHFQKWRADDCPEFYWPKEVKIPIRNVRLISVKDDTAVVPFSPGTHAYVKRTGFKEVRIYPTADKKGFVPVFIPYWKNDKPVSDKPIPENAKPIAIIRRGMIIELQKKPEKKYPSGKYRVVATMQGQIQLIPAHIKKDKVALLAAGFLENGINFKWDTFIKLLDREPPVAVEAIQKAKLGQGQYYPLSSLDEKERPN
jgi:CRISPR-associated endonuclease Csn1